MTNLRVLQLGKYYPPHKGGIETHLQALCEELQQHMDVRVMAANDARHSVESLVNGIPVHRAGTLLHISSAPICPGMIREIRGMKADLVHIHLPNPGAVLTYLASGHKGPLIVSYHSDTVRQKILGKGFQPILKRLLDRSAAIIATSPNYIVSSKVLAPYRDRCHVIPYGISTQRFQNPDPAAVAYLRARYGSRIVLSVGRLVYYKGFEHLIQAMLGVKGCLLIAGDGPLRASLQHRIQQLGIADRVHLLGEVEQPGGLAAQSEFRPETDLVSLCHAADVFVLPSVARSEAFGIVQLEAMACGKPVVNTSLDTGVPYVSQHAVTGLTVQPGDAGALAAAMNQLLDSDELRRRYGHAAQQRVEAEFNLESMLRRILALYAGVLRQPVQLDFTPVDGSIATSSRG